MADSLPIYTLGTKGVNVDKNPLSAADDELAAASNIIADPLGNQAGLKNRPGLIELNASNTAGTVLGGIGVPVLNLKTGARFFYIGRGPIA